MEDRKNHHFIVVGKMNGMSLLSHWTLCTQSKLSAESPWISQQCSTVLFMSGAILIIHEILGTITTERKAAVLNLITPTTSDMSHDQHNPTEAQSNP